MLIEGQRRGQPVGITHYSLEEGIDKGVFIVGGPQTVLEQIQRKKAEARINVLMGFFRFGGMPQARAFSSLQRFAEDILPQVRAM